MQLNNILLLMAEWQVKGLQLFVALSLLIILHEFGHFFFAKLFKTRVEKFYLFFDFLFPFGNMLNFSLFKKTKGDTTYGIGWFPLGGYVKIAGMVDESMDKEQMALPPQPWEFRSKPAWQRLFIMLGGIIVNVLVAIIIYSGVMAYWGESYLPNTSLKYGIAVDSVGKQLGFENGDKIVSVDGVAPIKFKSISKDILFNNVKEVTVLRNNENVVLPITEQMRGLILKKKSVAFINPRIPFVVEEVMKGSLAQQMGIEKGDSLIALNGQACNYRDQFIERAAQINAGDSFQVTFMTNKGTIKNLMGKMADTKKLGVMNKTDFEDFKMQTIHYGFIGSIARGVSFTGEQFNFYVSQFKLLFTSKEVKLNENLGGIGSFAKIFPSQFDWQDFWMLTAFISIILAFMNLLPIPGLDGGYVIFLLWEIITRRKVNEKVMEYATTAGLIFLLAFMLYANGLDIFRAFKN